MLLHKDFTNLSYDPQQGYFYRVRATSLAGYEIVRRLLPDEEGNLLAVDPRGNTIKKKAWNFAWIFLHGSIPDLHYVIQLRDDYVEDSFRLLDKVSYIRYKDAEYNLEGGIKISYEPRTYTYTVRYKEGNKIKAEKTKDSTIAQRIKNLLLEQSRDEVEKYL